MNTFLGLSQTAWIGVTALLTAGLLIVAFVAALYAARQVKIARQQADEAQKAALEASRPYVIVTVEPSRASQHLFDLVIRNIGQRPAMGVSIALDPPPIRANESDGYEMLKIKMLNEPVAMIAPRQELRTFYDSHIDRHGRDDLPTSHKVSLHYFDSSKRRYEEVGLIDLEATKGALYTEVKTIHHVGKSLAEIEKLLKRASLLSRRSSVEVAATVESRSEHQERQAREASEAQERHNRLVARVLPADTTAGDLTEAERRDPHWRSTGASITERSILAVAHRLARRIRAVTLARLVDDLVAPLAKHQHRHRRIRR